MSSAHAHVIIVHQHSQHSWTALRTGWVGIFNCGKFEMHAHLCGRNLSADSHNTGNEKMGHEIYEMRVVLFFFCGCSHSWRNPVKYADLIFPHVRGRTCGTCGGVHDLMIMFARPRWMQHVCANARAFAMQLLHTALHFAPILC